MCGSGVVGAGNFKPEDCARSVDWTVESMEGSSGGGCDEIVGCNSILCLAMVEKDLVPPVEVLGWVFAAPWPDLTWSLRTCGACFLVSFSSSKI